MDINHKIMWLIGFIFIFSILFKTSTFILDYSTTYTLTKQYPLLKDKTDTYHLTAQYIDTIMMGNELNPFYCPYELWKTNDNELTMHEIKKKKKNRELLLAYGPSNPDELNKRLRIMIVCGQHGREMITSEVCYHLIKLIQLQERDPDFTTRIAELTRKGVGFWILPLANPWARLEIETNPNKACLRKNKNGIDLNRNFERAPNDIIRSWDRHANKEILPEDEEYPGEFPMSEHETLSTDTLLDVSNPHILFNVHSGTNDILLPFDYSSDQLPENYKLMVRLAKLARIKTCPECKIGQSSLMLYDSHGTLMDYALTRKGVKLAYTIEIFESENVDNTIPANKLTPEQCMKWFNPEKGEKTTKTIIKWIDFILTLSEKAMDRFDKLQQ